MSVSHCLFFVPSKSIRTLWHFFTRTYLSRFRLATLLPFLSPFVLGSIHVLKRLLCLMVIFMLSTGGDESVIAQQAETGDAGGAEVAIPISGVVVYSDSLPKEIPPIDLGELSAGHKAYVAIEVKNSSGADFVIREARASCSCVDVKTSETKIVAGKSVFVKATLNLPKINRDTSQQQLITLVGNTETSTVQILLQYRLKGLCCFKEPVLYELVPLNVKSVDLKIPILISSPVEVGGVSITGTDDFLNVKVVIERDSNGVYAKCSVLLPADDGFSLNGQLELRNMITDSVDTLQLVVGRHQKASVLPSLIQFYHEGDEWKATAMIRLNKDSLPNEPGLPEVTVGCALGNLRVSVESNSIGRGIVRVKLSVKDTDLFVNGQYRFKSADRLQWQIGWAQGVGEVQTAVVFTK